MDNTAMIINQWMQQQDAIDKAHKQGLIGQSAIGAQYHPGSLITWVSACGYGPYTSIVLGSEIQAVGIAYWCETAPASEKKPKHLAPRYWVYPNDIEHAEKRQNKPTRPEQGALQRMSKITVNGKEIQVFDVQMDMKSLIAPDPDAKERFDRFNEAMKKAREKIVIEFDIPVQNAGTEYDGQIIPTGPVVEGSTEPIDDDTQLSDQEKYPLTLDHVRDFLATKNDNDPLGICHNSTYCLLSETLTWLYPEAAPWCVDLGSYAAPGISPLLLSRPLDFLLSAFDAGHFDLSMCSGGREPIVTKARLKTQLKKIAAKLPFAVTDLFPEENLESNEIE